MATTSTYGDAVSDDVAVETGEPMSDLPQEEEKRRIKICCGKINPNLFPLKLIFFFFLGSQGPVMNYRSLFTKHLGLSTTQTGIIWATDRVLGIFSPPLLGALSDKTRRPRDVIAAIFIISGIVLSAVCFLPRQHPRIDISCHDTDLYPVIMPRSGLQETADNPSKCYRFNKGDQARSLCASGKQNSTKVWMTKNMNESFSVIGRIADDCKPTEGDQNTTTAKPRFFLEKNSDAHDLVCIDGSCKRNDPVAGTSSSGPRVTSCICTPKKDEHNVYDNTFWSFLFMNLMLSLGLISSQGLVDAFVMNQLPRSKSHNFGLQRLWGSVGFGLCTALAGYLKDYIIENYPDTTDTNIPFLPIFQLSGLGCFLLTITVKCTKERQREDDEEEEKFNFSNVKTLLCDVRICMFLMFASAVGFSLGVGENYGFMLAVEKFGASDTVLGLSIGLCTFLDVVMYLASTKLLQTFGSNLVMIVGSQILTTKLLLYTFCTAPWNFILVEQLRGLSWGITWTAVCNHASEMAPPGLTATMMGLVSMAAWGVGYGLACLLGGILYDRVGGDLMFQLSFGFASSITVIYSVFVFCTKGKQKKRKKLTAEKEKVKTTKDFYQVVGDGDKKNGDINNNNNNSV